MRRLVRLPRIAVGFSALALIVAGCSLQPGPDASVKDWMQAFAAQDGLRLGGLTCAADQQDLAQGGALLTAFNILSASFLGGEKPKYAVDDLRYETVRSDSSVADVRVTGQMRVAIGLISQAQDIDSTLHVVRENGKWLVCPPAGSGDQLPASASQRLSSGPTNGPTVSPQQAAPTVPSISATAKPNPGVTDPRDVGGLWHTLVGNDVRIEQNREAIVATFVRPIWCTATPHDGPLGKVYTTFEDPHDGSPSITQYFSGAIRGNNIDATFVGCSSSGKSVPVISKLTLSDDGKQLGYIGADGKLTATLTHD